MTVDNKIFFAAVEERLDAGERVKITLVGTSMQPTLLGGDVLTLEPINSSPKLGEGDRREAVVEECVKVGDVVLFRYQGYHLLHRIVAIEGDRYTMRGDNCVNCEVARRADIVARLVEVEKHHRLKHLAVRWLGHKGRLQLRPWYFLGLAILMWAPLNGLGVPLNNYVLGLRLDHLLHASVFIPCSLFLWDLLGGGRRRWVIWVAAVGVGVLTETVQWLLPYRGFDINDMIANFLGVTLGWLAILIIRGKNNR